MGLSRLSKPAATARREDRFHGGDPAASDDETAESARFSWSVRALRSPRRALLAGCSRLVRSPLEMVVGLVLVHGVSPLESSTFG